MEKVIPLFKVYMSSDAIEAASEILGSGYIGQGSMVDEFEKELEAKFNHPFVVTTNSATSAEHLAIHMLKKPRKEYRDAYQGLVGVLNDWPGIEDGDIALSTPLTCTATNWPLLANGLRLKWVDVDPTTLNMDLDDLEKKITPQTKVIMVVHWGGYPLDLDKLKSIQARAREKYGFSPVIIEDCAHSFGSTYKGNPVGTTGNMATFSFQAIKHLTSIDGGALLLPHRELCDRAKLLRWYGIDRNTNKKDFRCEENIDEWGFKFHMNDVNASVGIQNLKYVDAVVQSHQSNAGFYDEQLKGLENVTTLSRHSNRTSAFWIYSLLVDNNRKFMDFMGEKGISVSKVHERNDIHTCVSEYSSELPNLNALDKRITSIPVGWWVTEEDRERIVEAIRQYDCKGGR